ncbi:type IV toxin-antitoxin system AbiEi family antitoxin domain-containing protein [Dermatobacter hominis]|uniref:type IV toxin-antitoxin system AbiEi family antitoxin domain-containing protein n=1 Tax=Dermatobacter hominis TaxID=2884263 RepID=UPI001D12B84F|nr:type IV toxin-antitoxin system AbiEi family antitoxin domain-containing protein [Dermatobacter hominis]UDY37351.1 type IV toxin-antitoxin system AbiEi family antitoxin domain-containing protein [Dermatobacter hominis]
MGIDDLAAMAAIAAAQDGVFALHQACADGIDRRAVHRAASSGLIVPIRHGVYRFTATPSSVRREVRAAVLSVGDGARASHESSLHLHGVPNLPIAGPVVSVPPGRRANHPGIRVHRLVDQRADHLIEVAGIPTTTPARAIVDVSSVFSRPRMEWVLDQVTITSRLVTPGAIARVFRQINHRGRRNIAALGELLDERVAAGTVDRSTLERQMDELLAPTSLPRPTKEHPIPSLAPGEGFADRAWAEALLILEIDGRPYHERRLAMRRDRARDRAAARMGWQTMRVLDEEVADEPDLVIADLVDTHAMRVAQLRGTTIA